MSIFIHRQHYYIVNVILIEEYVVMIAQIQAVVIQVEVEVMVSVLEGEVKEEGREVVHIVVHMYVIIMMITLNVDAVWIHVLKIPKLNVVTQIFAI